MKKFWLFSYYFALYGGSAFFVPFLVLYYQGLGFGGVEIGILTGVSPLIYLISAPFFTNIADRNGWHRPIMGLCSALMILLVALFPFVTGFVPVFLIVVGIYIFFGPITPFADSATMYLLGDEKDKYGRIRLGGTLGWAIIATVSGAMVEKYGLNSAFFAAAATFIIPFLISWMMVYQTTESQTSSQNSLGDLLQNPLWIRFLAIAFVAGLVFAVSNNYFFLYMSELKVPESMMGIALSIGTLVEIPLLFFGGQVLKYLKPYPLLVLAVLVAGLRLVLFAWVSDLGLVLVIQLLNGLTFIAAWLAGVAYANENAPESLSSTAQGLFSSMIFGFGAAGGGLIGGLLLERMNVQNIYFVVGISVFIAIFAISALFRFLPKQKLKNA